MILHFQGILKYLWRQSQTTLSDRKVIARRANMELVRNAIVNLGYGLPADVATVAAEELSELIILTTEAGAFGGVPAPHPISVILTMLKQ